MRVQAGSARDERLPLASCHDGGPAYEFAEGRSPALTRRTTRLALALLALLGVAGVFKWRLSATAGSAVRAPPATASPLELRARALRAEALAPRFEHLKPAHAPLPAPSPGEWLHEHDEAGQSLAEYLALPPTRATAERRTLYLLPLGDFTPEQLAALSATAEFLGHFFQLPVTTLEALPASAIDPKAVRTHPTGGQRQVRTTWIMTDVLLPRKPADAMAVLGLTALDLFPADDWSFVFGEASLEARVGVWSLYRNGDPRAAPAQFLTRTLKTAAHELGHQFSLRHCLAYRCVMNGSNSLEEADRQPMHLCPVCLAKLAQNVGFDPAARAGALAGFFKAQGLEAERRQAEEELAALSSAR